MSAIREKRSPSWPMMRLLGSNSCAEVVLNAARWIDLRRPKKKPDPWCTTLISVG